MTEQHLIAGSAEEWAALCLLVTAGAMICAGNAPPEGFFGKEVKKEEVAQLLVAALPLVKRIEEEVKSAKG